MVERTRTLNRRTFLGGAATFCVASFAVPSLAYATSSSELSQEAADLQSQADEVSQELINAQANLEAASEQYYKAQADHEAATQAAQEAQTKIDDATQQIQQVQTKLGTRARDMYRSGSSSFLDLLLGSTTFEEFATNWDLLSDMNEQDAALVQQTKDLRQEIEDQKAELDKQEAAAAAAEQSAKDASDSAASTTQMLQEKYATLTAAQQEKAQEAQAQAAQEQAAAAAAAQQQAAASNGDSNNSGTATGTDTNTNSDTGSNDNTNTNTDSGANTNTDSNTNTNTNSNSYSGSSGGTHPEAASYAESKIGCPYVWGAEGPNEFDCSGLVKWAYAQIGISVAHYTESIYAQAQSVMPVSSAARGDVLYRYGHVGIACVAGGTTYVHAPTFGALVRNTDALSWAGFTASLRL